ncbi:DUF4235 domain-containing protein [Ilumatobacter sp.]|uniref:DUF4235 domain-containing protein n=1 Tax=Ilumatobacter sp. TaxID=1967498 RepID=UPI003B529EEC
MKSSTKYNAISTVAGAGAAVGMRRLVSAIWPADPPKNPAEPGVLWRDALTWAIVSSIGAGVARVVAHRLTASGWERLTGDIAPQQS